VGGFLLYTLMARQLISIPFNPYISFLEDKNIQGAGNANILPPSGRAYINRTNLRPGMIECCEEGNAVISVFREH
jgi:hypothetical protein